MHGWGLPQYRAKTFFYDNGTPFAPRICHGKFAVTDARRGAEREPPRALLRTVRQHPWFGTVHGGPCPRDTRRALARRPCWDLHHGRRSAGAAFGTLRSAHAVPQSARSSAPFDPRVDSILPFARLGCSNRRGTVPDSSMLVRNFASNVARSATSRPNHATFKSHARSKVGAYPGVPRRFEHPSLANGPMDPIPRSNGADGGTLGLIGQISPPPPKWPILPTTSASNDRFIGPAQCNFGARRVGGSYGSGVSPGGAAAFF